MEKLCEHIEIAERELRELRERDPALFKKKYKKETTLGWRGAAKFLKERFPGYYPDEQLSLEKYLRRHGFPGWEKILAWERKRKQ